MEAAHIGDGLQYLERRGDAFMCHDTSIDLVYWYRVMVDE